jgi:hypothetical protein
MRHSRESKTPQQWLSSGAGWLEIEQLLVAVDATLASGDLDVLASAIADLELAGPLR